MSLKGNAETPDLSVLRGRISSLKSHTIDETLTVAGAAADAKATGDAIKAKAGNITINGIKPDENGNFKIPGIELGEGGTIIIKGEAIKGVVKSVNHIPPDKDGNVNIELGDILFDENGDPIIPGIEKDEDGTVIITGEAIEGVVRFVNHIPPDENGNVNITINGYSPDENGDFKIPGVTQDENGNILLPGVSVDEEGNVTWIGGGGNGTVTSVNNILPDASGNVEVPIPAIDDTLSIEGAAADAKMTGIAFQTVGVGAWDGILSIAATLKALMRKTKNLTVTIGSTNVNIAETLEDDAESNIDISLDSNGNPSSVNVNGYTFPVSWVGGTDG